MRDSGQPEHGDGDDDWELAWAAAEAQARGRLLAALDLDPDAPAPEGIVPAAAGARELVAGGHWPLDWVARAAAELPADDEALLLALLEAVIAPTHPTGLGDDEALLLTLEPEDWVDVALGLARASAGAAAGPAALVELVEAPNDLLEAAFELVVPAWQACGVLDLDERLTGLGAWLVPRAVEAALRS